LAAIIEKIPPPSGEVDEPLQALIFDSHYNPFRGIEVFSSEKRTIKKAKKLNSWLLVMNILLTKLVP
jgi:GTP-binding protein LepA